MKRSLTLQREAVRDLTTDELTSVVAGQAISARLDDCLNTDYVCYTDKERTTCLNCEA